MVKSEKKKNCSVRVMALLQLVLIFYEFPARPWYYGHTVSDSSFIYLPTRAIIHSPDKKMEESTGKSQL